MSARLPGSSLAGWTVKQATEWVATHDDSDSMESEELQAAFLALAGRPADDEDRRNGLWSLCCSMVPEGGTA